MERIEAKKGKTQPVEISQFVDERFETDNSHRYIENDIKSRDDQSISQF